MSDAEREFWTAFDYDPEVNRWLLADGLAPLDVHARSIVKYLADQEAVSRAVQSAKVS